MLLHLKYMLSKDAMESPIDLIIMPYTNYNIQFALLVHSGQIIYSNSPCLLAKGTKQISFKTYWNLLLHQLNFMFRTTC